ncbi:hypothetical protein [Subtercola endophyticus]|uniref:hypothetical protein n=1 Tax=Subtercola endophyticus TaxID=2895559 RepID=UPI001E2FEFB3|nr:hypothetical protein [Subtercola endophyticus]UFS60806.1 hypothetical protein LQ955_08755 [Subtercola endophyticus]
MYEALPPRGQADAREHPMVRQMRRRERRLYVTVLAVYLAAVGSFLLFGAEFGATTQAPSSTVAPSESGPSGEPVP